MKVKIVVLVSLALCAMRIHAAYCVPVYYPEGHYLGCGTPAADGSGIWTYDPKVPEKECHDIVNRGSTDWYLSGAVLGDFQTATKAMFDSSGFTLRDLRSGTQFGGGVVVPITNRFAADVGFTTGTGSITRVLRTTAPPEVTFESRTDFRIFTGSANARIYLDDTPHVVRPWISAGARGMALRPANGDAHPAAETSFATGAGVDVKVTPLIGVTLSGDHAFSTGWQVSARIVFDPWRPHPPCPWWQPPPCWEWPPYPFPLPFPFPFPGEAHNKTLDAVLIAIQNEAAIPSQTKRSKEQLLATADRSARTYIQSLDLGAGATVGYDAVQGQKLHVPVSQVPGFDRFTKGQQKYLLEIDGMTMQTDLRKFEDLGHRALRELGPSQAQPVVAAASVARGSIAYWNVRGETWQHAISDYLGDDTLAKRIKINWKEVWHADFIGAVTGLGGGVAGAVSGGAGGSAAEILWQVIS